MTMESNETQGTDGLTSELYRYYRNAISKFKVESFNYAFQHGSLPRMITELSTARYYFFNPKKE